MTFLPEIDKKKTIKQAEKKLKDYKRYLRMAGIRLEQRITQNWNAEPRGASNQKHSQIESIVSRKDEAERELEAIEEAVSFIDDDLGREIIERLYFSKETIKHYAIYADLSISHTFFYDLRNEALLQFAEAYKNGELLAFTWADCLGIRSQTVSDKINGIYDFKFGEAKKIRDTFFQKYDFVFLFSEKEEV